MDQYISKDAVVAEIEKKLQDLIACKENTSFIEHSVVLWAKIDMCNEILSLLDTLEVKENNLVEEIDYEDYVRFFKEHPNFNDGSWGFEKTWTFAQYCYKLGLKAREGE